MTQAQPRKAREVGVGRHQLAAVLERYNIKPDKPLTADDLAGLPLPERLWE